MSQHYSPTNYTPEESIGYLLKRAGNQLTLSVDRRLAPYEMTHAQLGIVLKLLHGHANTAADLARELMTDTGAVTRMLDRLEEKDVVQRNRSNVDRRIIEVALTEKGKQLADQMVQVVTDAMNQHLRGFNEAEVDQFKDFLRRMAANA